MIDSDIVVGVGLRITASKEDLVSRLAVVSRGVSSRTAVLVLGGIQLRAEEGRLHLAATDMEVSLRSSLEAQVGDEGTVVVPGRLLFDIARSLPDSEVAIEHKPEEAVVIVTSGTALYRLHTYSAEDFPRLPEIDDGATHAIDRDALVDTVNRVGRSASRDESRPVLTGILVRFEPGKVVMAATDSYRLAVKETAVSGPLPELDAIMPARALQEVTRIAAGADEVQLGLHENHVFFGADGTWLTTRRIDGQFPNYRQLLPEQFEHEVVLPREELLEVVRRVSLMAQRNSPLRLRFAEGELTVSAVTQDVGEARESIPAPYSSEALEIGFNAEFLRDGLESVDSESVRLKLISPLRPAVLEGDGDDYVYLIMPIRLAG
jgi:DNA polymerase III subunit beta